MRARRRSAASATCRTSLRSSRISYLVSDEAGRVTGDLILGSGGMR
jgi:hypothetical protein